MFCFPELCSTFSGVCSIFAGNLVPRTPVCYFSFLNYFSCVKASLILHSATSSHDFKKLAKHTEFRFALCRQSAAPRSRAAVQLCVRHRDTSRRSMVTFARARMFCRSFSVALGPSAAAAAACSLSSLGLPEVKRCSRKGRLTDCRSTFYGTWRQEEWERLFSAGVPEAAVRLSWLYSMQTTLQLLSLFFWADTRGCP